LIVVDRLFPAFSLFVAWPEWPFLPGAEGAVDAFGERTDDEVLFALSSVTDFRFVPA